MALNWLDGRLRRLQGPDRPWTILLQAELAEPAPHAAVEAAWRAVVAVRPEVHVSPGPTGDWVESGFEPAVVVGAVEPELDRARHGPDDAAVTVVVDADPTTTVSVVVDHSLTDGLGALAILEDLLRALRGGTVSTRPAVTDAALDSLRTRRLGLRAAIEQIPPRRIATLGETGAVTHLVSTALPLPPIHDVRRRHGASVGAVVARATLVALAAVRDRRATEPPARGARRGIVAVGMPADLRRHIGDPSGVGNAIVNITVTQRSGAGIDAVDTLIAARTTRRRLSETLSWVRRVTRPGPPSTTPRAGRDVATAMLSNLGRLGDDPVWDAATRIWFAPPAHQTLSIGVVGHPDELTLTLRSRATKADVTEALAADLADRLGSGRF